MSAPKARMTKQKQIILEELRSVTSHPTAYTVHEMVKKRLPNISLGTVYRNLERMTESGIIQRLDMGTDQRHYDGNPHEHNHIRCVGCGKIDDAFIDMGHEMHSRYASGIQESCGYKTIGMTVGFYGLCPECQADQD